MPKLTDTVVRQCKPNPDKRIEVADAGKPGLYLVVQPSGARSFAYRYRFGGEPRKLTIGQYPATTLAMAHDAADKAHDDVIHSIDPAKVKKLAREQGTPADDTLAAHIQLYREKHVAELRQSTASYTSAILEQLQDAFPGRTVISLRKSELIAFIEKPKGAASQNLRHKVCGTFLRWCAGRMDDWVSPLAGTKKPAKEKEPRKRKLNDAELTAVLKAAAKKGGVVYRLTWLLALTGCRRREIMALERREIVTDSPAYGHAIALPAARVKNKREHHVPLTDAMRMVLANCPKQGKHLLNGSDRPPGDHSGLKNRLPTLDTPWTFHDLRRTFASGMQTIGILPHIIELAINHRSGTFRGVAGIYQRHPHEAEVADAFARWSRHVLALVSDKKAAA